MTDGRDLVDGVVREAIATGATVLHREPRH